MVRFPVKGLLAATKEAGLTDGTSAARRHSRPGRLSDAEREARRAEVLDAAVEVLAEHGYRQATTARIARHAGASKETLYAWFGDRAGLFRAVIERNAARADAALEAALAGEEDVAEALAAFAERLLDLLLGAPALVVNRAAIAEVDSGGELAAVLLERGRFRTGTTAERYLRQQMDRGRLRDLDAGAAFQLLYGLVVEDRQIRALLGDATADTDHRAQARRAVARFLALLDPAG